MGVASKIESNRKLFERGLRALRKSAAFGEKKRLLRYLIPFACSGGHGYYSSDVIEDQLRIIGESLPVACEANVQPDHILIVMSRSWIFGGHTLLVRRWIETDLKRRYSVVFTADDAPIPPAEFLLAVEKSGGAVFYLSRGTDICDKAFELRSISGRYSAVIIFSSTNDVVPTVAYATNDFIRPVGLYNHADHRFWMGVCVSDVIAEMRVWGAKISRELRGVVAPQVIVPVPSGSCVRRSESKENLRRKLGLPIESRIIVTCGRATKYRPANGIDYADIIASILSRDDSVVIVGIGMSFDDFPSWRDVARNNGDRLIAKGVVDHEDLYDFYLAADLVIDSAPLNGITAMSDAITCGCPILSMTSDVEWITNSRAYCADVGTFIERAVEIVNDAGRASLLLNDVASRLEKCSGAESFKNKIDEFISVLLASKHLVRPFKSRWGENLSMDEFHLMAMKRQRIVLRIDLLIAIMRPVLLSRFIERFWNMIKTKRRSVVYGKN